jgi:hypothetical protein
MLNKMDKYKRHLAKRGSSRKLVSYLPFMSKFDDIWNISLNHQIVSMH